jgi:hypothetical protein
MTEQGLQQRYRAQGDRCAMLDTMGCGLARVLRSHYSLHTLKQRNENDQCRTHVDVHSDLLMVLRDCACLRSA